jgi:hypothetical protein
LGKRVHRAPGRFLEGGEHLIVVLTPPIDHDLDSSWIDAGQRSRGDVPVNRAQRQNARLSHEQQRAGRGCTLPSTGSKLGKF